MTSTSDDNNEIDIDVLISRLESAVAIVEEVIQLLTSVDEHATLFSTELQLLTIMRHKGSRLVRQAAYGCSDCTIPPVCVTPPSINSGRAGRPLLSVNVERIQFFRSAGYSWNEVASAVGVSRTTMWRRLRDLGIEFDKFSDMSIG